MPGLGGRKIGHEDRVSKEGRGEGEEEEEENEKKLFSIFFFLVWLGIINYVISYLPVYPGESVGAAARVWGLL